MSCCQGTDSSDYTCWGSEPPLPLDGESFYLLVSVPPLRYTFLDHGASYQDIYWNVESPFGKVEQWTPHLLYHAHQVGLISEDPTMPPPPYAFSRWHSLQRGELYWPNVLRDSRLDWCHPISPLDCQC